jgi:hypothetical protein
LLPTSTRSPWTEKVDDACFHRARAAGRQNQHVAAGLVQPLQTLRHLGDDIREISGAMPDRMFCHRE